MKLSTTKNYVPAVLILLKYSVGSLLSNPSKKYEQISLSLQNKIFPSLQGNNFHTVAIFGTIQKPNVNDLISDMLPKIKPFQRIAFRILNKIPEHNTENRTLITLTIVFMDDIQDGFNIFEYLINSKQYWQKDSKYILIALNDFNESLIFFLKNLWIKNKIFNGVMLFLDSTYNVQIYTYNPFKDQTENLTALQSFGITQLFPNKLKNLYGYTLKVIYWFVYPYAYKRNDGALKGIDFEFVMTFLKTINATAKLIETESYINGTEAVSKGEADLAAMSQFLLENMFLRSSYPYRLVDFVIFVENPKTSASFGNLFLLFDIYTWLAVIIVVVLFYGIKQFKQKLSYFDSLKVIMLSFSFVNIILTQAFQSWITTFLIYPKPIKRINTIDDLKESKFSVNAWHLWKNILSSKLQDQYLYGGIEYSYKLPFGEIKDGAYVVTSDFAKIVSTDELNKLFHQMDELVGTAYMVFCLSSESPYIEILNKITLRSLESGSGSKEWGGYSSMHPYRSIRHITKLNLNHLHQVFIIWISGIVWSILVFIAEIIWYRHVNFLEFVN